MSSGISLKSLGDRDEADRILQRARILPGYADFIKRGGEEATITTAPWTDKKNYLTKYPYEDIICDSINEVFSVFSSSGTSGEPFYWPQLKSEYSNKQEILSEFLERSFAVGSNRTLAVVGLALGSWIGGEHFSWLLKTYAVNTENAFSVFTPGCNHEEIIRIISKADRMTDQFILFICPSAISHLLLKAEEMRISLPLKKLRFVVIGEAFPEAFRENMDKEFAPDSEKNILYSIYGSADTGTLGIESDYSIALRQLLKNDSRFREIMGVEYTVPHFFHNIAENAYLEVENNELIITKWQGVPLLRYNLHDNARLFSWENIKRAAEKLAVDGKHEKDPLIRAIADAPAGLPDIIAIYGRADNTLILCGTNISEAVLNESVRCPELKGFLTGAYRAEIVYNGSLQRLLLRLETKQNSMLSDSEKKLIYRKLIGTIGFYQPEFLNDWKNFYYMQDDSPDKSILKIEYVGWPQLSKEQKIKCRSIIH